MGFQMKAITETLGRHEVITRFLDDPPPERRYANDIRDPKVSELQAQL
jgi:hypothetical protein